ncbi:unnamed protein product [Chrysodeixis includens]|uniref:Uncharacterized protein n=1 Tax=Chrysodeixis includens TaxID=689277 RepID=A0A9N8L1S1_CHRIL|nr:unnamed protein product [Chrysodeixis includens]
MVNQFPLENLVMKIQVLEHDREHLSTLLMFCHQLQKHHGRTANAFHVTLCSHQFRLCHKVLSEDHSTLKWHKFQTVFLKLHSLCNRFLLFEMIQK